MYYNNILETIGNTPLVKLNKIVAGVPGTILAKIETTNPGNSVKDRMALKMIEEAEKDGRLKPGGTIVEGTSGNTGMGLAIAGLIKGYKCIFVTTDKQSREKVDMLKAVGAEVIVCPTDVEPTDPRSYYSVSRRLGTEIPGGFYVNQYDNPANVQAHYESTGPEIWEQTEGKITHFVVGVGTGGTISGVGKFLKEKNPNIQIWGIDTYGSVFKKYHETGEFDEKEIYPYITEGIGEDILPKCVNFDVIDTFEKVTDRDGLIYQRKLAREEGILVGNSAGSAIAGLIQLKDRLKPEDVVVVLFHDHATRYMGKAFNDNWMRERGFLNDRPKIALDVIQHHQHLPLVTVSETDHASEAFAKMEKYGISQLPVQNDAGDFVGSLNDTHVMSLLLKDSTVRTKSVRDIMQKPFPQVDYHQSLEDVTKLINQDNPAVLVNDLIGIPHILTKNDIIAALAR
ncbi:MAG: pyridoxal-phosphate dependent enzyme [Flavobacteriales bacterium]|nr:pyridoxal-phosphate dependent enzyme [Bacteroidota bacterium]MCB9239769.1 pyridoxal-phosphate dependent enzyme [Flavobacteriales bacterium]